MAVPHFVFNFVFHFAFWQLSFQGHYESLLSHHFHISFVWFQITRRWQLLLWCWLQFSAKCLLLWWSSQFCTVVLEWENANLDSDTSKWKYKAVTSLGWVLQSGYIRKQWSHVTVSTKLLKNNSGCLHRKPQVLCSRNVMKENVSDSPLSSELSHILNASTDNHIILVLWYSIFSYIEN